MLLTGRRLAGAGLAVAGGVALGVSAPRFPQLLVPVLAVVLAAASTGYGKSDAP